MLTADLPGGWKQRVAFGAAVMHEQVCFSTSRPPASILTDDNFGAGLTSSPVKAWQYW